MSKSEQELPSGGQSGKAGSTDDQSSRVKKVFSDFDESEVAQTRKVGFTSLARPCCMFMPSVCSQKKWLDIKNTPCARNALIHGILGGFGTGLLYYLKSSEFVVAFCNQK